VGVLGHQSRLLSEHVLRAPLGDLLVEQLDVEGLQVRVVVPGPDAAAVLGQGLVLARPRVSTYSFLYRRWT
jgi:hypothetical protein